MIKKIFWPCAHGQRFGYYTVFMQEPLELMMVTFYVTLNGVVIILFND